jgi:hypothetical protein
MAAEHRGLVAVRSPVRGFVLESADQVKRSLAQMGQLDMHV